MIAWLTVDREKILEHWTRDFGDGGLYEDNVRGVEIARDREQRWHARVTGRFWDDGGCALLLRHVTRIWPTTVEIFRRNHGGGLTPRPPEITRDVLWAAGWRPVAPGTEEDPVLLPNGEKVESEEVQRSRIAENRRQYRFSHDPSLADLASQYVDVGTPAYLTQGTWHARYAALSDTGRTSAGDANTSNWPRLPPAAVVVEAWRAHDEVVAQAVAGEVSVRCSTTEEHPPGGPRFDEAIVPIVGRGEVALGWGGDTRDTRHRYRFETEAQRDRIVEVVRRAARDLGDAYEVEVEVVED